MLAQEGVELLGDLLASRDVEAGRQRLSPRHGNNSLLNLQIAFRAKHRHTLRGSAVAVAEGDGISINSSGCRGTIFPLGNRINTVSTTTELGSWNNDVFSGSANDLTLQSGYGVKDTIAGQKRCPAQAIRGRGNFKPGVEVALCHCSAL